MSRAEHAREQPSVDHARFRLVAEALAGFGVDDLETRLHNARHTGAGIGGTHVTIDVENTPVFVKLLPLTDRERHVDNVMSTRNLFDLPPACHYGVGSPSFSAWRELAVARTTSRWVLQGESQCFPRLYHWRVLETRLGALSDELVDVDHVVEHWHGSDAVRRRVGALNAATASVMLCFEHIRTPLPDWLGERTAAGDVGAFTTVDEQLRRAVLGMNRLGLFHFDAHLGNILTDGRQLRLVDFGLAVSSMFELSEAERSFLTDNSTHDICHTVTRLVDWLVTTLMHPNDWEARDELVREIAHDPNVVGDLPDAAAAIIARYAPVAIVINAFYRRLHLEDRWSPYPADAARKAAAQCHLETR